MDETPAISTGEDEKKTKQPEPTTITEKTKTENLPKTAEKECGICFCDDQCFLVECEHFYCVDCVVPYIQNEIDNSKIPIKCPANKCEFKYEPEWIFAWLKDDTERKNKFGEFMGGENDEYESVIEFKDCERKVSSGTKFTPVNYLQALSATLQNLYGADMYRLGVWADGCCFYHCIWEATDDEYQSITGDDAESRKLKRTTGQNKRVTFGKTIEEKDIIGCGIVQYNANDPNKSNVDPKTILSDIADPTKWAGDEDFLMMQYKKAVNVFLIDVKTGILNVEIPPSGIHSDELELNYDDKLFQADRGNILIMYHENLHFELLVRVDEKEKTMTRLFESSDPIISQLRSAFTKQRKIYSKQRQKMNLIT